MKSHRRVHKIPPLSSILSNTKPDHYFFRIHKSTWPKLSATEKDKIVILKKDLSPPVQCSTNFGLSRRYRP